MNEQLSLRRVALLLRNDALSGSRTLVIASLMVAFLMLIGATGVAYGGGSNAGFYSGQFLGTLFIWGTLATSLSFSDMHDKSRNTAFLLLPASALEKTLARLLLNTVGLIAYLLVFTTVVSFIAEGINLLVAGRRNAVFQPFDPVVWQVLPHYLVIQSLFFVGGAWFRKVNWIKTVLSIVIGLFGFLIVCLALAWAIGTARWTGTGFTVNADFFSNVYVPLRWFFDHIVVGAYFLVLPVFCWFVTWSRVRETQVSHGV